MVTFFILLILLLQDDTKVLETILDKKADIKSYKMNELDDNKRCMRKDLLDLQTGLLDPRGEYLVSYGEHAKDAGIPTATATPAAGKIIFHFAPLIMHLLLLSAKYILKRKSWYFIDLFFHVDDVLILISIQI